MLSPTLGMPVEDVVNLLGLSVRIRNTLKYNEVATFADILRLTDGVLLRTPNFGQKSLRELKEALAKHGYKLGMEVSA